MRLRLGTTLRALLVAMAASAGLFIVFVTRHVVWLEATSAIAFYDSHAREAWRRAAASSRLMISSSVVDGNAGVTTASLGPLQPGDEEERACTELLASSSRIMFLILGGRGYHNVRVRAILHSWARCVRHVLVFTDPSVNLSGYADSRRFVYSSAGDAWRCA